MISQSGPNKNNEYVISVSGEFDFNQVENFDQAYLKIPKGDFPIIVDFRKTEYMDSSGLGMLMKLRKHFGKEADIRLRTPNKQIMNILEIARFHEVFAIE